MKIELKHIAPYLPYKVKAITAQKDIVEVEGLYTFGDIYSTIGDTPFYTILLILRPLSDLTKEIEIEGKKFVPIELIKDIMYEVEQRYDFPISMYINGSWVYSCEELPYDLVQKLFEWHFNVFGLIEKGLAVDINTLKL
jgi:hypothetical protein